MNTFDEANIATYRSRDAYVEEAGLRGKANSYMAIGITSLLFLILYIFGYTTIGQSVFVLLLISLFAVASVKYFIPTVAGYQYDAYKKRQG